MLHTNGSDDKTRAKGHAIFARGGVVKMDDDLRGGSVLGDSGTLYRVDFDLGGRAHCQCRAFEYTGWCKHLDALTIAADATEAELEPDAADLYDEQEHAYAEMVGAGLERWTR